LKIKHPINPKRLTGIPAEFWQQTRKFHWPTIAQNGQFSK